MKLVEKNDDADRPQKKTWIDPNSIFSMKEEQLYPVDKFLLVRLVHLQYSFREESGGTGKIFVRNSELSKDLNASERTITKSLKRLEEKGYIKRYRVPNIRTMITEVNNKKILGILAEAPRNHRQWEWLDDTYQLPPKNRERYINGRKYYPGKKKRKTSTAKTVDGGEC